MSKKEKVRKQQIQPKKQPIQQKQVKTIMQLVKIKRKIKKNASELMVIF